MVKHNLLKWKPVKCKSTKGNIVKVPLPEVIAIHYRGTLLSKILSMEKKKPISFEVAINLIAEEQNKAFATGQMGSNFGQYSWYPNNFVKFISNLGYHIELTGDEFETYMLTDKLIGTT